MFYILTRIFILCMQLVNSSHGLLVPVPRGRARTVVPFIFPPLRKTSKTPALLTSLNEGQTSKSSSFSLNSALSAHWAFATA